MIKYFSQIDPRWSRKTLGKTSLSIYSWGCLLATVCNAAIKLIDSTVTPKHANEILGYTREGEITHDSIKKLGIGNLRIWHRPSEQTMKGIGKDPDRAVAVRMNYNPRHWVLVTAWTVWWKPWFLCADPYTYNPQTKTCRIVRKLKWNIDGAFVFRKLD